MHALTIARRNTAMDWKFLFKTSEAAEAAYVAATNSIGHAMPAFEIRDDFGQRGRFNPVDITGVLMEDLDESKLAHIEHALHEMKTRATIGQRMQNDPQLKFAQMNAASPPVLRPM